MNVIKPLIVAALVSRTDAVALICKPSTMTQYCNGRSVVVLVLPWCLGSSALGVAGFGRAPGCEEVRDLRVASGLLATSFVPEASRAHPLRAESRLCAFVFAG